MCKNIEHLKEPHKEGKCEYCGLSDCSPNFAYHFCRGYKLHIVVVYPEGWKEAGCSKIIVR